MEVTIKNKDLLRACTIAKQLKGGIRPEKDYLLLSVSDCLIMGYCSNNYQDVRIKIGGKIKHEGECYLPLKRMIRMLKYNKNDVHIKSDSKQIIISSGIDTDKITITLYTDKLEGLNYKLRTESAVNVPMPDDFSRRLSYALSCVCREDSRPVLTGVCFDYKYGELSMNSEDGFRLVIVNDKIKYSGKAFRYTIPYQALDIVKSNMNERVEAYFDKENNSVWFVSDDLTVYTKMIQDTFPSVTQLLPQEPPQWTINCIAPILHKRLLQISDDIANIIRLTQNNNLLHIRNSIEDYHSTEIVINAGLKGNGKIAVNKQYLTELSKYFSEMNMEITTPTQPIKVTGDLKDVTFLIMPMFVQW